MRKSLVIFLALTVSACGADRLHSSHPLLTDSTANLRDGVWLYADDSCPVDVRLSPRRWPDCARWAVIRVGWASEQTGPLRSTPRDWSPLVADMGDPGLLQTGDDGEYGYELMQPIATDTQGRLVEIRRRPVLCSDHLTGMKDEPDDADVNDAEPQPPAAGSAPPTSDEDDEGPPPPELPGAYRIGDRCYTDTPISLTTAQLRATQEQRFPGNFRWVRETVR